MIGYEFLVSKIQMPMLSPVRPARVSAVTRIDDSRPDCIAVPRSVAPLTDRILDHVLFALRYEPINIPILHESMKLVSDVEMGAALRNTPTGSYLRMATFFWEKANERILPDFALDNGGWVKIFSEDDYYTGQDWERNSRLRIAFNGIGPYQYCPVVKRDQRLEEEGNQIFSELRHWVAQETSTDPDRLDRVLEWAYLSETKSSFEIEQESPSPRKTEAFLQAMRHVTENRALDEAFLVQLQNAVITSQFEQEATFRMSQNWLERSGRGVLAVRYVPPTPDALKDLMTGFLAMANSEDNVPPLIKAALVSFGFVYLHPFMDGNGRLSRLLAHYTLTQKGVFPDQQKAWILPLSVAMRHDEQGYLQALTAFSTPSKNLWEITAIDRDKFDFKYLSSPLCYGSWQGDVAANFLTQVAKTALKESLIDESVYLENYDEAFSRLDALLDLPGKKINLLIQWVYQNEGRLAHGRRNSDITASLSDEQIASIENIVSESFGLHENSLKAAPRAR